MLAAAAALFEESGWAGTTVTAIAKRADVAVETVYSSFGSKRELLHRVVDAAIVGDTDPVPLAEREVFVRVGEGTLDERIDTGIEMLADIQARIARLWRTVGEATASDDEVDAWRRQAEADRRVDVHRSIERILGEPVDDVTVDLLWGLFSHEVYALLVFDHGLDRAAYVAYMRDAVRRLTSR